MHSANLSLPPRRSSARPLTAAEQLSLFKLETLMLMFYTAPRDLLQAVAAQELYRRDWKYHSELRIWLKARSPQELMAAQPTVQFQYFDAGAWEARLFTTAFRGNILQGLLTEDDVRVNLPLPGAGQGGASVGVTAQLGGTLP